MQLNSHMKALNFILSIGAILSGFAHGATFDKETILSSFHQEMSCSTVDLEPLLKGLPPRHQGNSNFCYAVVTADLLTAKLGRPVSAIDVAFQAVQKNRGAGEGGTLKSALSGLQGLGACALESKETADQFDQLNAPDCTNRISVEHLRAKTLTSMEYSLLTPSQFERQKLLLAEVDLMLNEKKAMAITYYSDDCVFCTPGFHVVTLMGRYFDRESRKCMYRLRNSYGEYDEGPNFFGVFAKDGYIHMPREVAVQEFMFIQYLVEKAL